MLSIFRFDSVPVWSDDQNDHILAGFQRSQIAGSMERRGLQLRSWRFHHPFHLPPELLYMLFQGVRGCKRSRQGSSLVLLVLAFERFLCQFLLAVARALLSLFLVRFHRLQSVLDAFVLGSLNAAVGAVESPVKVFSKQRIDLQDRSCGVLLLDHVTNCQRPFVVTILKVLRG